MFLPHARQLHSGQLAAEAGFAHVLEHFAHLGVLAQELVHFLHAGSGAPRDALAPAAIDDLMMIALFRRHGINDGFHAGDLAFVH